MKIKWTIEEREVPNIGIFRPEKEYDLPDDVAKAFIKQGQATEVKPKKKIIIDKGE